MTPLLSAWLAEIVLIAYRGAKNGTSAQNPIPGLALPSEYASTFIIYGALAFVPAQGQRFAAAVGWGLVVATFLNLWTPGKTVSGGAPQPPTFSTSGAGNTANAANVDTGRLQKGH